MLLHESLFGFQERSGEKYKTYLRDEDPNDPEVFANDLSDTFQETFDLINEKMNKEDFSEFIDEEELDFNDEPDIEIDDIERHSSTVRSSQNPLINTNEKLFKDFLEYYKTMNSKYPNESLENTDNILGGNLAVLSWYTLQIHVKARMGIWGKSKLQKLKNQL